MPGRGVVGIRGCPLLFRSVATDLWWTDLLADRRSYGASAGGDTHGSRTCSTEPDLTPPDTPPGRRTGMIRPRRAPPRGIRGGPEGLCPPPPPRGPPSPPGTPPSRR